MTLINQLIVRKRLRAIIAFLILIATLKALGQDIDTIVPEVLLIIKPNICVAQRGQKTCTSSMDINWSSSIKGAYCLHSNHSSGALLCWSNAAMGQHSDKVKLTKDLHYWLVFDETNITISYNYGQAGCFKTTS